MAPIREQPDQDMDQLVQRNVILDDLLLVKKDRGNDDNGKGHHGQLDDDDHDKHHDDDRDRDAATLSIELDTKTAWTRATNTAWATQTAITTSSGAMTVTVSSTATSTSRCSTSTSKSITTASAPSTTSFTASSRIPSSEQPRRKGVCTLSNGAPCESGSATTSTVIAYKAIGANAAPTAQADQYSSPSSVSPSLYEMHPDHGDLGPLAEKFLISVASIGMFIIFCAIIYFVIRMKKSNRLAKGEISEEEARWYGWRRNRDGSVRPPSYTSGQVSQNGYLVDEKFTQREMAAYYNADRKIPLGRPESATVNLRGLRTDLQRQNSTGISQSGLGMSPSPVAGPGQSYPFHSNADVYYSQSGTRRFQQAESLGRSSNAYDPSQREVNRISYLSSISSGFGDSLAMLDDSPPPQNPVSRFSWTTASQGGARNRDTIYTTTSEETAPRFRTVNSWVAQQTGRVEQKQQSVMEVPAMPEIPISYTHRSQVPYPLFTGGHQRQASDNSVFKYHPGDEIGFGGGSRVPSSVLDRKLGI
ncbi:hypothetical protein DSL72_009109 [Monilinia vaccinii-corymbosi]|uniref:Uncharacterized protein n=1 Tax=Monilinia vaccinii-corymbosi TaxID=61207 RepID=A0A8A3PNG1_9HELO|nr:hypothetical protein DSL72_009109 [Monilinia vaccinii-corymbosi]